MYSYKKISNTNLIKVTRNLNPVRLCLTTNIQKSIYHDHDKHYIDVEINDEIYDVIYEIKCKSENYIHENISKTITVYKDNIRDNVIKLKLPRRYDRYQVIFKNQNGNLCTSSDLKTGLNISTELQLDYIWYNQNNWGFDFKVKNIIINNVGKPT
jgi:hypothetical protein